MSINVRNLDGVLAQLEAVKAEFGFAPLGKAARESFKRVVETARSMVPVDSGDLRNALQLRLMKSKGDTSVRVGIKIASGTARARQARLAAAAFNEGQSRRLPPSRRWHFVELGTVRMAPHPYLRPALDANAQAVVDDLKRQLVKAIEAAVKKKAKGSTR